MTDEQIKKLLNEWSKMTAEPVRPALAEDIKRRIPHTLIHHRIGRDTVNIIIDLRISKLTAAAVIIITMILLVGIFDSRDSTGTGLFQDSKLLIKYCLAWAGAGRSSVVADRTTYEHLIQQGKDVVYYGDAIDPQDSNAVLMHWKLSNGNYKVIFADLRQSEVSAEQLIKLQARMLQKKAK